MGLMLMALLATILGPAAYAADNWAYPEPIASWGEADRQKQRDDATALLQALRTAIAQKQPEFTVAPGHYRFDRDGMWNIPIRGAENLVIDATGATFWFDGRHRADSLLLSDCRNVAIRGLTVDYDPLCFSQGEVLSIDRDSRTVDVRIDPGFPVPDDEWTGQSGKIKAVFYSPEGFMRDVRMDWVKAVQPVGDGCLRVSFQGGYIFTDGSDFRIGDRLTFPDRSLRHVVATNESEAVSFEDMTIYASPQMALTEVGGEGGHAYRRIKVIRRPDTRRLVACNADVFHSIFVKRGPTIEECEFSHSADDFINVHGFFSMVLEQRSPTEVVVVQHFGRSFDEGSKLAFYDFDDLGPLGEATVKKLTVIEDSAVIDSAKRMPAELTERGDRTREFHPRNVWPCLLELDRPINTAKYDLVGCEDRMATGTTIRANYFHDTFTRGILLKCVNATVSDNRIERTGQAGIGMVAERYWLEGPYPNNITVSGNTLTDCGTMMNSRMSYQDMLGAISVIAGGARSLSPGMQHHNIRITGNTIVRPSVCGIFAANLRDSVIENNVIEQACFREPIRAGRDLGLDNVQYSIYGAAMDNVVIRGNQISQPGDYCRGDIGIGPGTNAQGVPEAN